jgi:phosphohistidine phosphatase
LTGEGREKLREVLRVAAAAGVAPTVMMSSPLARAVETAEIAAKALNFDGSILQTRSLEPGAAPEETWQELRIHDHQDELLLAGHQPHVSEFAAFLLGVPDLQIEFRKGAMMRIRVDGSGPRPRGVLEWMLTARLARS